MHDTRSTPRWVCASLYDTRSSSDFDHYVQDLVQFSKVVLPATVGRYSGGRTPNMTGGEDGGGSTATGGKTDSSSSSSLPPGHDFCGGAGEGDGDGEKLNLRVVAHSMGGLVAVNAAVGEPQLFNGVRERQTDRQTRRRRLSLRCFVLSVYFVRHWRSLRGTRW